MILYGVSGLGADERVYKGLSLDCEFVFINWIKPFKHEPLKNYAKRLSAVVDTSQEFGLIGVSFGGVVAIEIAKILTPKLIILISSIEKSTEMNIFYKAYGKSNLSLLLPHSFYKLPKGLAMYLFGTKSILLKQILDDTDLTFVKWAVRTLLKWESLDSVSRLYRVHGTKDRLFKPPTANNKTFLFENEGHFLIVDKAKEVSDLINLILLSN